MNSCFEERDLWQGSPYDVSMPQFLTFLEESPTKKPSNTNDELKILIEPAVSLLQRPNEPALSSPIIVFQARAYRTSWALCIVPSS